MCATQVASPLPTTPTVADFDRIEVRGAIDVEVTVAANDRPTVRTRSTGVWTRVDGLTLYVTQTSGTPGFLQLTVPRLHAAVVEEEALLTVVEPGSDPVIVWVDEGALETVFDARSARLHRAPLPREDHGLAGR